MLGSPWCQVVLRPPVLDAPAPLGEHEAALWRRLRSAADRDRRATGHHLVREAAAAVTGRRPDQVEVERRCPRCGSADHGPLRVPGLGVSVSHTAGLVAVAVTAGAPVGVDVEVVPDGGPPRVADVALTAAEQREHAAVGTAEDLLVRWVRKEAVLKAAGTGLAEGAQGLRVAPPGRRPRVVAWSGPSRPAGRGRAALADLPVPPGYAGAVAVLGARRLHLSVR